MSVLLITASYDQSIRFWDASSGVCTKMFTNTDSQVNRMAIAQNKSILALACNPVVKIFDLHSLSGKPVFSLSHKTNVTAVGFFQDPKIVYSGSEDKTVKVWDIRAQPTCTREFRMNSYVSGVQLSPNSNIIYSADNEAHVCVWDLNANACLKEYTVGTDTSITSLSISPDGALLSAATREGDVVLLSAAALCGAEDTHGVVVGKFKAHDTYVLQSSFAHNGNILSTSSADSTTKLWWLNQNVSPNGEMTSPQESTTFSPTLLRQLRGHSKWVWDNAFTVDAKYIVTCSSDQTARLWDVSSGDVVKTYVGHQKAVTAVALNDLA